MSLCGTIRVRVPRECPPFWADLTNKVAAPPPPPPSPLTIWPAGARPYAACGRHSAYLSHTHASLISPPSPTAYTHLPTHPRRRPTAPIPPDGATPNPRQPYPTRSLTAQPHPTRSPTAQPHPTPYHGTHGDRSVATVPHSRTPTTGKLDSTPMRAAPPPPPRPSGDLLPGAEVVQAEAGK